MVRDLKITQMEFDQCFKDYNDEHFEKLIGATFCVTTDFKNRKTFKPKFSKEKY